MGRRPAIVIATLAAAVLCLSSYEIAAANAPNPASVSATQGLGACATAAGYLRLVDGSAKCPTGYAKVSLAQAYTVPRSLTMNDSSGTQDKTVSVAGHTSLDAHCEVLNGGASGELYLTHNTGSTYLDGTSLSYSNGNAADFVSSVTSRTPKQIQNGTNEFEYDTDGYFYIQNPSGESTNLELTLLVITSSGTYHLQAGLHIGGDECRINASIQLTA